MRNNVTEGLIAAIKKTISKDESIVNVIMNILFIGKESAYRRIRGDVAFTLDEVAKISIHLGLSIDSIIEANNKNKAMFTLNLVEPDNLMENYSNKLLFYIDIFTKMKSANTSIARFALNTLPYSFYLPHENLAKFRLYRWLYQMSNPSYIHTTFGKIQIPTNVIARQKLFVKESRSIKKVIFILDRNVFSSFIYDINYFFKLELISKEEVQILKKEMLTLLSDLEIIAATGRNPNGTEVQLYLSNVDLETSYSHYEYDDQEYSHLRVYSIDGIGSHNTEACHKQKEWIESLRRYSTLISQSGEMQRFEYFNKQRAEIMNIDI